MAILLGMLMLFAGVAIAADETGAVDIVANMEAARADEEGETARDQYLEDRYREEETVISRTPGPSTVEQIEVWTDAEPPPFQSKVLSEPQYAPESVGR